VHFASNKEEISSDSFADADVVVFGGPREPFTVGEFKEIKNLLATGGRVLIMVGEGGEKSNINYLLEEYGMSVNNDSVTRSAYYKYLHPKEVFIGDGVLVPDIIRKKVGDEFFPFLRFLLTL
jgi:intraflagellar transport protein 52